MIKDLNNIYDPEQIEQGPGDPPKVNKKSGSLADSYLSLRGSTPNAMPRAGATFSTAEVAPSDVEKFLGEEGVGDPNITGQSTLFDVGQRQSVWNKIGRRTANLVPNMAASLIDIVGYAGALVGEWGDNRDYDNAITQFTQQLRDPTGVNYPRTDQSTIGSSLSDPTWWIDNGFQLVEFAVPFAVGGAGIGTAFSEAASGTAAALRLGAQGTRIAANLGRVASAGMLAYSEAAQAGAQVFKEVYDTQVGKQLASGYDLDTAKENAQHIASQSAATTVQMATIMSTALNLYSISPYFRKTDDVVNDIMAKEMRQLPGENTAEWGNRIKNFQPGKNVLMPHEGILGNLTAAGFEGVEEVVQQFAQVTGTDLGKEGKTKGFTEQWDQLDKFIDRTANKDGVLSFALGALGGGAMELVQQHVLPTARIDRLASDGNPIQATSSDGDLQFDTNGNPVYQKAWVTPRKADEWNMHQRFSSIKESLASDISHFSSAQGAYVNAVRSGNSVKIDEAKNDLFNVAQIYAVKAGITEPWVETYQNIANMSQQEAVQRGYATDENDTSYKEKATEAATDLQRYAEEYDKLHSRYGTQYADNVGAQQMVDMMFARKVDLMSWEKMLDKHESSLRTAEQEEAATVRSNSIEAFSTTLGSLFSQVQATNEVRRRLQTDLSGIRIALENNDIGGLKRLVKKYRAIGINDADLPGAIKDLQRKITTHNETINARLKSLEDTVFASPEYTEWLERNPDGSFEQFMKDVQKKYTLNVNNIGYRADIEESRQQYEIAQQNYADITKEKNVASFAKKAGDWFSRLQEERAAAEQANNNEMSRRAKDKTSLNRLQKIELNEFANRYQDMYNENRRRYDLAKEKLSDIERKANAISIWRDPVLKTGLMNEIRNLRNEISTLDKQGERLMSAYQQYSVDTSTPVEELPVEELTNENADVEEEPVDLEGGEIVPYTNEPIEDIYGYEEFMGSLVMQIPDSIIDEAYETYHTLARFIQGGLESHVRVAMSDIEEKLRTGEIGFSLDLLNNEVAKGYITQSNAAQLLQLLKDYLDIVEANQVATEMDQIGENTTPPSTIEEVPDLDTTDIPNPDSPVINNLDDIQGTSLPTEDDSDTSESPAEGATHAGYKTINVLTIANTTLEYTEAYNEAKNKYYKIPLNTLNPELNQDILRSDRVLPGTPIRYEVDTEYDGDANINDYMALNDEGKREMRTEKFTDYIDTNGKVSSKNAWNVPIKIVDSTSNKTIGYVRKLDWVTAKYPNTTDYRNVVSTLVDKEGNEIDNLAIQVRNIQQLREAIVNQFNASQKPTEGRVLLKKGGQLILNRDVNLNTGKSEVKLGFARSSKEENSLLPDPNLTIAIVGNSVAYSGYEFPFPKPLNHEKVDMINGSVVAMIPTANGNYTYAGLVGQRLVEGKKRSAVTTVSRAIELYLLNDGTNPNISDEIIKIQKNTGFDISTETGLRNFINQYFTYTRSFRLTDTAVNAPVPPGGSRTPSFEFQIWDRIGNQTKGNIKTAWTYSGRPIVEAVIKNGSLNPEFAQALEEGFTTRSRAVVYTDINRKIIGINSTGTFRDAIYTTDGKWRFNEYPSYNEYVKSFSRTAIYGKNKLDDGSYTYVANPAIVIDAMSSMPLVDTKSNDNGTKPIVPTTITEIISQEDPPFDASGSDLFDNLVQFSLTSFSHNIQAQEIGTGPENSRTLSIQTLEELYTFTPIEQRNGKTVQDVYDEMSRRGQTFLAEGHNPFSRCL